MNVWIRTPKGERVEVTTDVARHLISRGEAKQADAPKAKPKRESAKPKRSTTKKPATDEGTDVRPDPDAA